MKHLNTSTLALVMFFALAFLGASHGKDPETGASAPPQATKAEVVIDNFNFSPKTSAVPVGATVRWINHDSVPHLIMSADNQFQKSPVLKAGQSFSLTFGSAGSYAYFCSIHPRMTGQIIVK